MPKVHVSDDCSGQTYCISDEPDDSTVEIDLTDAELVDLKRCEAEYYAWQGKTGRLLEEKLG